MRLPIPILMTPAKPIPTAAVAPTVDAIVVRSATECARLQMMTSAGVALALARAKASAAPAVFARKSSAVRKIAPATKSPKPYQARRFRRSESMANRIAHSAPTSARPRGRSSCRSLESAVFGQGGPART